MQQNKTQQNRRNKRTNNNHRAIIVWKQNINKERKMNQNPLANLTQNKAKFHETHANQ